MPEAITGSGGSAAARTLWRKVMEPLHKNEPSKSLYDKANFVSTQVCKDCGKLATSACSMDVRTHEHGLSRVETVLVYPEDVPTAPCDCHVVVDYCLDCKAVANSGCTHVAKRSLVKMTQSKVNEIIKASNVGLWSSCKGENYIYLVDKQGNPVAFYGFNGDKNYGLNLPYVSCHIHKAIAELPILID